MRVIYNKVFPFKKHGYINLFGVLFIHGSCTEYTLSTYEFNRESIRCAQMADFCPVLLIGGLIYYVTYILFITRSYFTTIPVGLRPSHVSNPFVVEIGTHESDGSYVSTRKKFAWKKFLH